MEPKACVVSYDAASESYDIYAPTQGMVLMRPNITAITGVPAEKVRIHARDVGGGFGVRSQAYSEYCALMLAAQRLGRPVKWVGSRFETIVSDHHGAPRSSGRARARPRRTLPRAAHALGRERGRVPLAAGAAHQHAQSGEPRDQRLSHPGAVRPHILALTNTTSTTAYRGAGRPNVSYLVERLVDEAAREMNIDRADIRRRNFIRAMRSRTRHRSARPTTAATRPANLRSHSKSPIGKASARRKMLRGIGCAVFCEPSGAGARRRRKPRSSSARRVRPRCTCCPGRAGRDTRRCCQR